MNSNNNVRDQVLCSLGPQDGGVGLLLGSFQSRPHFLLRSSCHGTAGARGGDLEASNSRVGQYFVRQKAQVKHREPMVSAKSMVL